MKAPAMACVAAVLAIGSVASAAADAPPPNDCDRLAAHPADGNRVVPGVQWDVMNARAAIRACSDAVAEHPDVLRFQFQLGRALLRAQRRDEGLPYLFAAAEKNYAAAFANIGGTYQFDLGNYSEALKWYRRGAELGDISSQTHLAEMYLEGWGVERNLQQALRWYEPAANQRYPLAEYKIGLIYQRGDRTVPRDQTKAITWFRKAAEQGFARAQNDLGYAYEQGLGVRRNLQAAADWYLKAAEQGWGKAQINVALLYERGRGVDRDYREAFYWFRKATGARLQEIQEAGRAGMARTRHRISSTDIAAVERRIAADRPTATAAAPAPTPVVTPSAKSSTQVDTAYRPPSDVDTTYRPEPAETEVAKPAATEPEPTTTETAAVPPSDGPATPAAPAPAPAAQQPMPAFEPVMAAYTAVANANVRSAPGTEAPKVDRIGKGNEITVLGRVKGSNWLLVALPNNETGYVFADLLEPKTETSVQTAAVEPKAETAEAKRDAAESVKSAATIALLQTLGNYHALVIGNNDYKDLPKLKTAVSDAETVAEVLKSSYGFEVRLLRNATRADIIIALDDYRKTLTEDDNLLIYYAGHGILDYSSERGYWLPIDASPDTQVSWVSNATITDTLKAMSAKHVMLVVDSCYSGTLTRSVKPTLRSPDYLKRMVQKRARVVLTSGGLEPVADGGGGDHSVFAKAFINALQSTTDYIDGTELFLSIRRPVMLNAAQTPEYSDIRLSGHDGGDFVFVRRDGS